MAIVAAGAILLIYNALAYLPFFNDDAFISLRYSDRLLAGHGLTWNDGERVEGYSNLLWVLACALLGAVGLDLVLAARILGCAAAIGMMSAFAYHFLRAGRTGALAALGAVLVLAVSGTVVVWTIGGMEQLLLACLLAWALVLSFALLGERRPDERRRAVVVGVLLGLAAWTRPDGALWTAVVGATLLLVHPRRRAVRLALTVASVPAAFVLAQLLFRLAYYHAWLPNTALAKLAWTPERRASGYAYLAGVARAYWPLALLGATALPALRDAGTRRRLLLCLAAFVAWAGYLWGIGGDIFPAHRHAIPLVILAALIAGEGVFWLAGRQRLLGPLLAAALCTMVVWRVDVLRRNNPENLRAYRELWVWGAVPVARALRAHFPHDSLMAVDTAGALPYFSQLPSVDMLGLVDNFLTRHPPPDFGKRFIGHDLGNGRYVRDRNPDLLVFCLPVGTEQPCFRSGRELIEQPGFFDDYELVTLDLPQGLRAKLWVSRRSLRLHPPAPEGRIVVPGYLLGNQGRLRVREHDGLLVVVTGALPARASHVMVPAGRWDVRLSPAAPDAVVTAFAGGEPAVGAGHVGFSQRGSGPVDIELAPATPGRELTLQELTLVPLASAD